jgi:DNA-binding CsgD family transcriptional regulator
MAIASAQRSRIYRLWDDLADIPAGDIDRALEHALRTLCEWLRADNAMWIGAVRMARGARAHRDPQNGWRGLVVRTLQNNTDNARQVRRAMHEQDTDPGMTTIALMRKAGEFRVQRLRDGFVDFAAFRRTAHYRQHYLDRDIADRLWAMFPLNPEVESCFVFDAQRPRRRFTARDAALAAEALRGIRWFHRRLMLSYGLLVARRPLQPAQHRLLAMLLTGKSEAQIAQTLGLTKSTVHTYVTALYRQLGVDSRAALMARWLG